MQEPVPGISAVPDEQNARYFHVVVAGKIYLYFYKIEYVCVFTKFLKSQFQQSLD